MALEAVKIPQNVYIEDRIVGPLTLRQIITVAVGCGFSYAVWASLNKAYGSIDIFTTILVWIPGALSFLFAFIRINDLSLLKICFLMYERSQKAPIRTFSARQGLVIHIRIFKDPKDEAKTANLPVQKKEPGLSELSSILDNADRNSIGARRLDAITGGKPVPVRVAKAAEPAPAPRPVVTADPLDPFDGFDDIVPPPPSARGPVFRDLSPAS